MFNRNNACWVSWIIHFCLYRNQYAIRCIFGTHSHEPCFCLKELTTPGLSLEALQLCEHLRNNVLVSSCRNCIPSYIHTLISPTLLYRTEIRGSNVCNSEDWRDMEVPLVSMIVCVVRSKHKYHTKCLELGAVPIVVEMLFQVAACIHWIWELPRHWYPWHAFT